MSQVCLDVFNGPGAFTFISREWSHIVLLVHQCALLKMKLILSIERAKEHCEKMNFSVLCRVKISHSQSTASFLLAGVRVADGVGSNPVSLTPL